VYALFNGEGEKKSPKSHLNSDLNELKSTSRIGRDIQKIMGISQDQRVSEKITPNENQLNSDFYRSI